MHCFNSYKKILFLLCVTCVVVVSNRESRQICTRSRKNQVCSKITAEKSDCKNVKNHALPHCAMPVEELFQGFYLRGLVDLPSFTPPWLNETLYSVGQKWARENYFFLTFCHFVGALLVACGADAGKVILGTGKSHVLEKALPSSVDVQYGNSSAEQGADWIKENLDWPLDEAMWDAVLMDLIASNIPEQYRRYSENILESIKTSKITLNQYHMGTTQHLFVAIPFIVRDRVDITNPAEEQILGWNHLWAVLGYAMGIEDEFNVALHPSLEETHAYYTEYFNKIILPGLFNIETDSKILVEVLLKTLHQLTPSFNVFSPRLLMAVILEDVIGIETPNVQSLLTNVEKLSFHVRTPLKGLMKYGPQFVTDKVNSWVKENADRKLSLFIDIITIIITSERTSILMFAVLGL
ncbi:unnamed protein product, partial [Allacma fusca]